MRLLVHSKEEYAFWSWCFEGLDIELVCSEEQPVGVFTPIDDEGNYMKPRGWWQDTVSGPVGHEKLDQVMNSMETTLAEARLKELRDETS